MNILFADPNRDLLNGYGRLLERNGHTVTAVFDGPQAIAKIVSARFDAAIVSDQLPRLDPGRVVRMLQEARTPVLLLTADGGESRMQADAILRFPFLPRELYASLAELTKNSEPPIETESR